MKDDTGFYGLEFRRAVQKQIPAPAAPYTLPTPQAWTPTISQPGSLAYTDNGCWYVDYGSTVLLHMNVNMDAAGTAGQALTISNLPFSAWSSTNQPCVGAFRFWNGSTGYIGSVLVMSGDASKLLFQTHTGSNFTPAVNNTTELSFTAWYRKA